jgi:glutathione synthase/RimK-type ligase-like ATP-grasp enzyme
MQTVLVWGITADRPLELVYSSLKRQRARCLFLDQKSVLQSKVNLTFDGHLQGSLHTPAWSAELESVTAVYLRPYDVRRITDIRDQRASGAGFRRAAQFEDILLCWIEMTPALVVNRPSAMSSNNSKPYQLQLIRSVGFEVPETLVTTDPQAVIEFWERHGSVIYKSVSGVRSIVTRLGPNHLGRIQDIAHCPTQFQRYIEGTDVRVHVVGDEIFCCEISSTADDYRYPRPQDATLAVHCCKIPENVESLCRKLANSMNLAVAGIDLRRTASGNWYCFEVNPSPGFTFYEEATGQPIGEAIASLLIRGGIRPD